MDTAFKQVFGKSLYDDEYEINGVKIPLGRIIDRGLPAYYGIDISAALTMTNPTEYVKSPMKFFGRYANIVWDMIQGRWDNVEANLKPRMVKKAQEMADVVKSEKVKSKRGSAIADVPKSELWKMALGFPAKEVMKTYEIANEKRDIEKWYKDNVLDRVNKWAKYASVDDTKNTTKTIEDLEKMQKKLRDEWETAKGLYRYQLAVKYEKLSRALANDRLFENALKRQEQGILERDNDSVLQEYGIERMKQLQ